MNKVLPWIGVGVVAVIAIFMFSGRGVNTSDISGTNVTVKDGTQYVTVNVHGGYSPKISGIQSGLPTKLVMKTNNTYDCSSSLVIRSLGYRNVLPATGATEIDLGTPKSGEKIAGTCGMGMYSFAINVN